MFVEMGNLADDAGLELLILLLPPPKWEGKGGFDFRLNLERPGGGQVWLLLLPQNTELLGCILLLAIVDH